MSAYTQSYGHIRDAAKRAGWYAANFIERHDRLTLSVMFVRNQSEPHVIIDVDTCEHPLAQQKQVYTTLRMHG